MLDTETKRRIDTARDILVGKLPDPKSQVEQITIALIYKFMDDMDNEVEELGGKPTFFSGEFKKYSWSNIFDPRVGGYELVILYGEAIQKMNQNPNIPQLFRDIFKNAYLPYRDPETLKAFLKVIDDFKYDHSEKLGDAFEYLLSVMSSQGEAGQFRTPRHIIDFIVKVVDPDKNETILDPACGTAGFLISSYKYILSKYTNNEGKKSLTPDEKKRLIDNFVGYDISPDMVRLSLVNMYLHSFSKPKVYEYDTLTSEEKWNDFFDVIMANPPFMTPKGGIRPHKRFSIQANRSEVLFVDYIHEHLNPNGKAGIIVPEGIIFQNGSAYKRLRKMLIEHSLYAVVSLPAGVFNPYSGVKTSILFFDKNLVKKTNKILFVKVNHDGFNLGAQRRKINENDLPIAFAIIQRFQKNVRERSELELNKVEQRYAVVLQKEDVSNDFNLSGDRYREEEAYTGKWELIELGEIAEFTRGPFGSSIKKSVCVPKGPNTYKIYEQGNVINNDFKRGEYYVTKEKFNELSRFEINPNDILITCAGTLGRIATVPENIEAGIINSVLMRIRINELLIKNQYLVKILGSDYIQDRIAKKSTGVAINNLFATKQLKKFKIPLPPLEIQEQIVTEIESNQKIIDGAKKIVENYKPSFTVEPEWEFQELRKFARVINGRAFKQEELLDKGPTPVLRVGNFFSNRKWYYSDLKLEEDKYCDKGDLLYAWSASFGPRIWQGPKVIYHYHNWKIEVDSSVDKKFLYYILEKDTEKIKSDGRGIAMIHITKSGIEKRKFPVPPIETQKEIVAQIEEEQRLVESNKKLIEIFEKKIKDKISEVWGENE